jgi:putative endonuclease
MADPRHQLGAAGERLAESYLRQRGLRPVAAHYATPVGELDLVMCDGPTVVFVEVKTRTDAAWADPQDAVNRTKQRKLARCARWFLARRNWAERPCRFDVIAITLAAGSPRIEHFPDVFAPEGP